MKPLSDGDVEALAGAARQVRLEILNAFVAGGGKGHYGGCFSVVEILVTLYDKLMRLDPATRGWPDRDRLILSKGHANVALCAVLAQHGFFDRRLLSDYGKMDCPIGMHPNMHAVPGCDMSTGSLGHGLAIGIGMAMAGRADRKGYQVYVVLGDGECDEGSVWEAAAVASHHKLNNLTAIVDRNRLSMEGFTEEIASLEPFDERWSSFGWQVIEVDGHDFRQLHRALVQARETRARPTVLIANTVKGKGVSLMEGSPNWHVNSLAADQVEITRAELTRGIR